MYYKQQVLQSLFKLLLFFSDGSVGKVISFTHVLAASVAGLIGDKSRVVVRDQKIIPFLERTESGRVAKLEKFSHYVGKCC